MDILGIGPLELLFILIIILVVLGPHEMVKTGALVGRYLRRLMMSPTWKLIQDTSREIRHLPNRLARQAGLDEIQKEMREGIDLPKIGDLPGQIEKEMRFEAWTNPDPGAPPEAATSPVDGEGEAPVAEKPDPGPPARPAEEAEEAE